MAKFLSSTREPYILSFDENEVVVVAPPQFGQLLKTDIDISKLNSSKGTSMQFNLAPIHTLWSLLMQVDDKDILGVERQPGEEWSAVASLFNCCRHR